MSSTAQVAPLTLSAAVFLLFAPIGLLVGLVQTSAWGWGGGLAAAVFSGLNALLWQHAISRRRWLMLGVVALLPFVGQWAFFAPLNAAGLYALGSGLSEGWRRVILAAMAVASLSLGFTLLIRYLSASERRSARAKAELDVARRMHDSIVPTIAHNAGWATVHAVSLPSSEMGGDLVDLIPRADNGLDLVLADVSGHGVGAGLVMGMFKGAVRARVLAEGDPGEVATDLNRVFHDLVPGHVFLTAALLRASPSGLVEFALAGHLPIYIRRAGGEVETLENECLPIGVASDERIVCRSVRLEKGDAAVVFTDGLMEVKDRSGKLLGLDPLRAAIGRSDGASALAVAEAILAAAQAHGLPSDDQSVLVLRIS